ncbi:MAG: hypothetical protein ACRDE5_18375, partial [Ginsengibacter sp.]
VIIMGLGSVLTGLSIYKPIQFHTLCALLGGYEWARIEHFILTILFTLFFVVHIVQVILAGWNNFRSMVTGLDVLKPGNVILQPVAVNTVKEPVQSIEPSAKSFESEPGETIETDKIKSLEGEDIPPAENKLPHEEDETDNTTDYEL